MGAKVQRKFYFLLVSDKALICLDNGTSTPIDNPSGFSGRSSIPNSANCIELKPNLPDSFDGFCPNSGIVLPEKSYTDYDEETETLIIKKAVADGNCGYTMSTTKVQLTTKREYNLYVRAIIVFPVIGANYTTIGGTHQGQPIRVAFFDAYYYVFSDLSSAVNWDLSKMLHSTSQLISPFSVSQSGSSVVIQRFYRYLQLSNSNINNKYKIRDIPPSGSFNDPLYYNAGSTSFGRYDPDIQQDSHTYIKDYYDLLPNNDDIMFDWRNPGFSDNIHLVRFWPLAYDKITNYSTYSRAVSNPSTNQQVVSEALGLINSFFGFDDIPGIYDMPYGTVQINAVQYYPLEPLPKTSNNTYRNLYPDERFYWPPDSGTSWSRSYMAVPAIYRSYASGQTVGPYGEQVSKIKNTIIRIYQGNNLETRYGNYDFSNGKFWSVDENCNLVYLEDDLETVAGVERRIITNYIDRQLRVQSGQTRYAAFGIFIHPSVTPIVLGNGVVQWISLKYAIDIIYTFTFSRTSTSITDPITVRPPAVCPPSSLPVMANNMAYIAD
jgi:hypothetical protein